MRILIRYGSTIRKFMVLETSDRDGSLNLTVRRKGVSRSQATWSNKPGEQDPRTTEFERPRPNNKRVTIHQSGRVNYHGHGSTIFIAPLTRTTQPFPIYRYRVPALDKLDVHDKDVAEEDAVLDLSDLSAGPVSFTVLLTPKDFIPQGRAVKLTYEAEGYSVLIQVEPVAFAVPADLHQHFAMLIPHRGLFPDQQMAEDQAMISYHRALTGTPGLIVYMPNGEGTIRVIFSVPMKIAPRFKIELVDPELHVSDQDVQRDGRSEKVMLKFKIRNRETGQIIREPVEIRLIELEAEF